MFGGKLNVTEGKSKGKKRMVRAERIIGGGNKPGVDDKPEETTFNVDEITLTDAGQTIWSTKKVKSPPLVVSTREIETFSQTIQRETGPEAEQAMFKWIAIPTRVMSDQAMGRVPTSTIQ